MTSNGNRLPVTILTGFLGSGKTTILNRLLKLPDLVDTAVIVNEFGEVGLDHLLIEQAFENAVLLKNGCICCTVRGDLADTLTTLWEKMAAGEIPEFSRLVIETTGLADPGPVAHTLVDALNTGYACRLDGIITTVDSVHALGQIERQQEARNQIAFADRIFLTKTDLADAPKITATEQAVRRLNPQAPISAVLNGSVQAADFFDLSPDATANTKKIADWLSGSAHAVSLHEHGHEHGHEHRHHDACIHSTVVTAQAPLRFEALAYWLDSLLSLRGTEILRMKGIVWLQGHDAPLLLQGVHHMLHPATWLTPRAALPVRTEIVFITRGLSTRGLQESFAVAQAATI